MSELLSEPGTGSGSRLVKICGVTRPDDAALAAELGADLIGLNFYPPSPRSLDPASDRRRIAEIVAAAEDVPLVGVFVDDDPDRIEEIFEQAALDRVQLHGDETPAAVRRFGRRAIQVFRRARPPERSEIALYPRVWGFLFDVPARRPGGGRRRSASLYGGTGETWNYEMLVGLELDRPVLVAGGIRPGTARRVLIASGAAGVDVCSGVESAPGVKDTERMKQLFEEVRHGTS